MARPNAVNDQYDVNENQVFEAGMMVTGQPTLLNNDSDPDNDDIIVDRVRVGSTTTTIAGTGTTEFTTAGGATVTLDNDGNFEYDPGDGFQSLGRGEEATDSFQYRVRDTNNETSAFATVEFTVDGRNDAPEVEDDTVTIDEIGPATLNILANDSDVDTNDTFDVRNFQFVEFTVNGNPSSTGPSNQNIAVNGFEQEENIVGFGPNGDYTISVSENGDVVFTPGESIRDELDAGDVGEITFRYRAQDDSGAGNNNDTSEYADVTITINGLDPAPRVFGRAATLFVDPNTNEIVGRGFSAGTDYDAFGRRLLSNTDGSLNPNDIIAGTDGNDNIWAGTQGSDLVRAGDGDDTVGIQNGTVTTGAGVDFVYSTAEGGNLDVNLGNGFNQLWSLADTSTTVANNGGGNYGYSDGDDRLTTGSGDDFVYDIEGAPSGGVKTLRLGAGNNTVSLGGLESSTIVTLNGMDEIDLEGGRHNISTGGGDDVIFIASGTDDDVVDAGTGNDYVQIAGGNDVVTAGAGSDTVFAGGGRDTIFGEDGNDFLYGEASDDILVGGDGDDTLYGGVGFNTVTGGADNDVFVIETGGNQTITDFNLVGNIGPLSIGDRIGLRGGLTFENLTFKQQGLGIGSNVSLEIKSGSETLADVQNIDLLTSSQLQTQAALYTTV